jgi:hypothetical protein
VDSLKFHERAGGKRSSPVITIRRTLRSCLRTCSIAACFVGLLVSGNSVAAAQDPTPEPTQPGNPSPAGLTRVAVHGIVRDAASGEPLARALVQIEGDAETGTLTNNEGRFEIPAVPVGPQIFRVVKPGFRDRPYASDESSLQSEGPAHSVLVAAQMPELDFALAPNSAIHGHIELSTGDPADGITVLLLRQEIRFGRSVWVQEASNRANGDGFYRFGGLPDGVYAVLTQPALESEPAVSVVASGSAAHVARSGYPTVFYPDALDLAGATRIRLSNGAQAEANLALTLEPFYPVTAVAATPAVASGGKAGEPVSSTAVIMNAAGHLLPYPVQYDEATHSLQANLPDGTYVLVVRGFLPPNSELDRIVDLRERFSGRRQGAVAGSAEFTVAGHAVTGLRVPLVPPQDASVHLRIVHNPDFPANSTVNGVVDGDLANLTLDPADSAPFNNVEGVWSMNTDSDTITFTAQPGSYWLNAFLPRRGLCAGSFTAGSFNLAREPLPLSLAAPPPPMELTLRDDCGTLAISLPPALQAFLPGEEPFYTLYVIPDFDTVQNIPPMTMHASSGATLTLDSLTPGSYRVYFFDSPVRLEYRNSAAMAAMANPGQQVTVSAGSTANLVLEAPAH